ncbi:hypothetical protein JYU34_022439 [Plutella xylostella]|uniref:CCHC-type domain-containing protein n=2 Tax=Plutella xylostella TaxID=51655 RepID=A0ABQ7PR08_PLUXY|nr:hypothetical protein JYU34_022439 [Plutella xylostella]
MSNAEASPFNRSSRTARSPPPASPCTRDHQHHEEKPAPPVIEVISTPEIQKWMAHIESCLNEVCIISTEGKLNSDQKLRIATLCRKIGAGTSQMAVQYQSVKQHAISAQEKIEHLYEQGGVRKCLEALNTSIQDVCKKQPISTSSQPSFADVIKKGNNQVIRPSNSSSIAIFPANKEKSSEDTKNLVQKIISPEELKLHVSSVRKTKHGGVIISTERKEDIQKLKQCEKFNSSGLTISEVSKRKPRIVIIDVPNNLSNNQVIDYLYEQNIADHFPNSERESIVSNIKLSHLSGKKGGLYSNYILEVPADVRKLLISQRRVYLHWSSCPVRDYTYVSRCFKCQQYGHSAKFCREPESTCGHCGQVGHTIKECPQTTEPPVCATCLRFKKPSDHKTGEEACPARKFAELKMINSTDYEVPTSGLI